MIGLLHIKKWVGKLRYLKCEAFLPYSAAARSQTGTAAWLRGIPCSLPILNSIPVTCALPFVYKGGQTGVRVGVHLRLLWQGTEVQGLSPPFFRADRPGYSRAPSLRRPFFRGDRSGYSRAPEGTRSLSHQCRIEGKIPPGGG